MLKKAILLTLLIELMAVTLEFLLRPDAPVVFHIVVMSMITIVSICFGIVYYHTLKQEED